MTYVRIGRFIQSMAKEKVIKENFRKNKADLIDIVERARKSIPLKQVLKCFNLSETTYNLWVLGMYSDCSKSKLDWCLVRQPQQLKMAEVEKMEEMLLDPNYEHWPISSLAHYARRNDLLHASPSTWYKYANILRLKRKKPKYRKVKNGPGIRAARPNEIWHADVTYFKVGLKNYYVYLLVDNFSRKVLSHLVSPELSAKNRLLTIRNAYEKEFGSYEQDVMLLVDGGKENNNHLVDNYISLLPNLTKLRALHDIRFGNSQIEAHNKILKQGWLYRIPIDDPEVLVSEVERFVEEFNEVRPHHSLGGMTPSEMHDGCENYNNASFKIISKNARKERYTENRCNACARCAFATV